MAFSERGYSVRFSPFYRHAKYWSTRQSALTAEAKLALNAADLALLNQAGDWIPDYMWPEEGEGYSAMETGVRPHVSDAAAIDPEFQPVSSMGYQDSSFTFKSGYTNTNNIANLRQAVSQKQAVTLFIQADLFQPGNRDLFQWNEKTGLLENKYTHDNLAKAIQRGGQGQNFVTANNHSVAVVGYDDTLYANVGYSTPGAYIVRNSWNEGSEIQAVSQPPSTAAEVAALKQFRLKLSPINLAGYYAIPYQYVLDLVADQSGGFEVMTMNFDAFAKSYENFASRYETYSAPYLCDTLSIPSFYRLKEQALISEILQDESKLEDPATLDSQKPQLISDIYSIVQPEILSRYSFFTGLRFQYAKISSNVVKGIDRLQDFYSGKFNSYYCGSSSGSDAHGAVWPSQKSLTSPEVIRGLKELGVSTGSAENWIDYLSALGRAIF